MILYGVLGRAFERDCIRGFARLSDLAKSSWADNDYQRNFDEEQIDEMIGYLKSGSAFFPEVILSYKEPPATAQVSGIGVVARLTGFTENGTANSAQQWQVSGGAAPQPQFRVSRKAQPRMTRQDIRGRDENYVLLVTFEIEDAELSNEEVPRNRMNPGRPFFRIDGNHRLIAGENYSKAQQAGRRPDAPPADEFMVPFCLLLLPNDEGYLTTERLIFSNINSKSLPLTQEQLLRAGIDDKSVIDDATLLKSPYGPAFLLVRRTFQDCLTHDLEIRQWNHAIELLDKKGPDGQTIVELGYLRTVLKEAYELLLVAKMVDAPTNESAGSLPIGSFASSNTPATADRMVKALLRAKRLYDETPQLKYSESVELIAALVRYAFEQDEFLLQRFCEWALNNHLDELPSIKAADAIAIFERIRRSRSRTIFVSMPFDGSCDAHFKMIEQVVKNFNGTHKPRHRELFIKPVRVDQLVEGKTQKISDAIFREIQQSGMLIADLTGKNANVYHEVGYLMGLNKHTSQPAPNLLFICNTRETKVPQDIGFNLRDYSIVTFRDTVELEPLLTKHIEACYATGDARRPTLPSNEDGVAEGGAEDGL